MYEQGSLSADDGDGREHFWYYECPGTREEALEHQRAGADEAADCARHRESPVWVCLSSKESRSRVRTVAKDAHVLKALHVPCSKDRFARGSHREGASLEPDACRSPSVHLQVVAAGDVNGILLRSRYSLGQIGDGKTVCRDGCARDSAEWRVG